jgi:hypothetical protein
MAYVALSDSEEEVSNCVLAAEQSAASARIKDRGRVASVDNAAMTAATATAWR